VAEALLPSLLLLFSHKSADVRFGALKSFTDITLAIIAHSDLYLAAEKKSAAPSLTRTINALVTEQLLPAMQQVLNDREPVPQVVTVLA